MIKNEITIHTQKYVDETLIQEFKTSLENTDEFTVINTKEKGEYYNASGYIPEILLFINENATALIVSNLLIRPLYDILKGSIINLYVKTKSYFKAKKDGNKNGKTIISLQITTDTNFNCDFNMEGNISEENIEKTIDNIFTLLKDQQHLEIMKNKDFVTKENGIEKLTFELDKDKNIWLPTNYGKIRSEMNEFQKRMEKKF